MTAMLRTIAIVTASALGAVLSLAAFIAAAFALTYVDETIESGEAYGFAIGETKRDAFEKILEAPFARHGVYVGPTHATLEIHGPETLAVAARSDRWVLFLGEEPMAMDSLRLKFADERLVEIHRHKQLFEVP